jgi:uncharacterized protein (DUF433 family)
MRQKAAITRIEQNISAMMGMPMIEGEHASRGAAHKKLLLHFPQLQRVTSQLCRLFAHSLLNRKSG